MQTTWSSWAKPAVCRGFQTLCRSNSILQRLFFPLLKCSHIFNCAMLYTVQSLSWITFKNILLPENIRQLLHCLCIAYIKRKMNHLPALLCSKPVRMCSWGWGWQKHVLCVLSNTLNMIWAATITLTDTAPEKWTVIVREMKEGYKWLYIRSETTSLSVHFCSERQKKIVFCLFVYFGIASKGLWPSFQSLQVQIPPQDLEETSFLCLWYSKNSTAIWFVISMGHKVCISGDLVVTCSGLRMRLDLRTDALSGYLGGRLGRAETSFKRKTWNATNTLFNQWQRWR